jgi:tetratricopeptide (TPR) repeat protein
VSPRRTFDLRAARADGWFARLSDGSREFTQLCQIVGERFVAFGAIAGVQIRAITVDRRAPDASLVDFVVGDDPVEQRLALGELRRRLAAAMLADEPDPVVDLGAEPDGEALQAFVGVRTILLAGLYGVTPLRLHVGGGAGPSVTFRDGSGPEEERVLDDLRELLRDKVRADLHRVRPQTPFAIDLSRVPEAERALGDGQLDRVVELLGAWPGPLSLLLRTAEGQALVPDTRATLAHALALLGRAYGRLGRFDWADEVLRLGIQWAQEGRAAPELFACLAETYVDRDRHGEAIGVLRRALTLGAEPAEVLPLLARCYAARDKWVAAMVCIEQALAAGVEPHAVAALRQQAEARLGAAWRRLREAIPGRVAPVGPSLLPPSGRPAAARAGSGGAVAEGAGPCGGGSGPAVAASPSGVVGSEQR